MDECATQSCSICSDILPRWYEPLESTRFSDFTGLIRESSLKWDNKKQRWAMKVSRLKQLSATCKLCKFLLECLDCSPWMVYDDNDYIELKVSSIGVSHTSEAGWEKDHTEEQIKMGFRSSNFEKFHRPRLQLFKLRQGNKPRYAPDASLFILPMASRGSEVGGRNLDQVFYGRQVNGMVSVSLINRWLKSCQTCHLEASMVVSRLPRVESCVPAQKHFISQFRLIDVKQKCIVLASNQDYAILSYVWGDSRRFLLTGRNVAELSVPGSLPHQKQSLPKTFQDAMTLTERLGLRFIWIDALCIIQDDSEHLVEHMNSMDLIYSSAMLTIVSDTKSADTGIPGVGYPRPAAQATFESAEQHFISSKVPLDRALRNSAWQRRAWCFQEELFSRRRLIFTDVQAYFHCGYETWSEDMVMEISEYPGGYVAATGGPADMSLKKGSGCGRLSNSKFTSLIQEYSQRDLSFTDDVLRATSGILRSLEEENGPAIWGVPQKLFKEGLTWVHFPHDMHLRQPQFPSWSWAGWAGNTSSRLHFKSVRDWASDYWDVEWHCHRVDYEGKLEFAVIGNPPTEEWNQKNESRWLIPGHPGEPDYTAQELPKFDHDSLIMPSLGHILRFYTSVATLLLSKGAANVHTLRDESTKPYAEYQYQLTVPGTSDIVGSISLDSSWAGTGKLGTFVHISREHPIVPWDATHHDEASERLNIMLVEGDGEVKTRVSISSDFNLHTWRKAKPVWSLVTLA